MAIDPWHLPRLLEVHEVAYQLKCSQETVRRLIREGKLLAVRLTDRSLRVDPHDLSAFIEAHKRRIADTARAPEVPPGARITRVAPLVVAPPAAAPEDAV